MENKPEKTLKTSGPIFLDITADVCPLTFVRTKLLLEGMTPGDLAEIRLQGAEPLANVPRTLRAQGHEIISLKPEDPAGGASSVHRLHVRKAAD
jgi:TusA-related sulfurtransferase